MAAAYSHPRLGLQTYVGGGGDTDTDSSSSGELVRRSLITRPASTQGGPRRRRSYGDVALAVGTVQCDDVKPLRGTVVRANGDDDDDDECQLGIALAEATPRYVSFEDLIGTETFTFWKKKNGGGGDGQLPADERDVVTDPLIVNTAPRLYKHNQVATVKPPRKRGRSPGPLGTRRGSAMHGIVKRYVHPFFGFIAGIFCCSIPS